MAIILISVLVWQYCQYKKWQEEERRRYEEEMQLLETVTPRTRGEMSERKTVLRLLHMGIDNRAIFHDCYVRKPNGEYTQIDLVVASKVGLLVFEIKDYSGWIFGNAQQKYWTQMLAYGKEKHLFYNPIMQNIAGSGTEATPGDGLFYFPLEDAGGVVVGLHEFELHSLRLHRVKVDGVGGAFCCAIVVSPGHRLPVA